MTTRHDWSAWATRALEWGWLACILLIPSYFNLLSARHFEPDKAVVFRAIVTVLLGIAAAAWVWRRSTTQASRLRRTLPDGPLTYSIVAFVVVFLIATAISIVPGVSFWGSYQRLQGTYTNLCYIALALVVVTHLRTPAQFWRLCGAVILSAVIPALYGIVQHSEADPLPWKGDVITRVASTMGNSIFIAAFLILVLPYLFAVIIHLWQQRPDESTPTDTPLADVIASGVALVGAVGLVFTAIQFSGVFRTIDLRFWWVYPGALLVACVSMITLLSAQQRATPPRWLIPAGLASVYALALVAVGQTDADVKALYPTDGRYGTNWAWWLLGSTLCLWVPFFAPYLTSQTLAHTRLRRTAALALSGLTLVIVATIFFTQSRGPWIGGAVGVVFFCTVALRELHRQSPGYRALAQRLLIAEAVSVFVLAAGLLVFNVSDHPAVVELRRLPYIGRMGKLFDVSAGTTGDVRMKIWFGDEHGSGTIGLITADPLRTVVGWGPESMFVAYNRFYPPSLATVESRSASPDRSHEAFLDELVNKGLLGLLSYLAVIITSLRYGFSLLRRPTIGAYRHVVIAALSAIVAHVVEGLTGIPVVSSLLLFWLSIGTLLTVGHLSLPAEPIATPPAEPAPTTKPLQTGRRRGPTTNRPLAPVSTSPVWAFPAAISMVVVSIALAWLWNLDNAYADMRFQQGTSYAEAGTQAGNTDQQIIALSHFIDAIAMEPSQDYYYLSAGRSLLNLADAKRRLGGNSLASQPATMADLAALGGARELKSFLEPRATTDLVRLAADYLLHAHDLNPYNKDHFANLARLYTFWYTRVEQTPALEAEIFRWYEAGIANAPNDVSILNEYVGALIARANRIATSDPTTAADLRARAHEALDRSKILDPTYADTAIRTADLAYADGDYATAVPLYSAILQRDPHALDGQITTIADQLTGNPTVLSQLRDAYLETPYQADRILLSIIGLLSSRLRDYPAAIDAFGQLVALQPQSIEAIQNYTIVLSNGLEYEQAAIQAQSLIDLATQQQLPAETIGLYEQLRSYYLSQQP